MSRNRKIARICIRKSHVFSDNFSGTVLLTLRNTYRQLLHKSVSLFFTWYASSNTTMSQELLFWFYVADWCKFSIYFFTGYRQSRSKVKHNAVGDYIQREKTKSLSFLIWCICCANLEFVTQPANIIESLLNWYHVGNRIRKIQVWVNKFRCGLAWGYVATARYLKL